MGRGVKGDKSTLEKYRSREARKFEMWLNREEGRTIFNTREGSLGLRNRGQQRKKRAKNVRRGRLVMNNMWCFKNVQHVE